MKCWVSLRVVIADTEEGAIQEVCEGNFVEEHNLCDRIFPLSRIFIRPKTRKEIIADDPR